MTDKFILKSNSVAHNKVLIAYSLIQWQIREVTTESTEKFTV